MLEFTDKVVLVTGSSRGIGRAIAEAFTDRGARLAIHCNANLDAAEQVLTALAGSGHHVFRADIGDPDACERLIGEVRDEMGGLDILVNNAGIFEPAPFDSTNYAAWRANWDRTLAINLTGPANLCFLAARVMAESGGGRIVNVSSRGAVRGEPDAPAYGASKAGLNALGQSLAVALARYRISVGTVAPGFVETDMTESMLSGAAGEAIRRQSPLGRVARPQEVAEAVLFLASEGAEFSTGTIIDVNGASYLRS